MNDTQVKKRAGKLWSFFDPESSQQMYILSLCIQYGWQKQHPKTGRTVADLGRLDRWLRGTAKSGQSPVKKPLAKMSGHELSIVISALENMVTKKHQSNP